MSMSKLNIGSTYFHISHKIREKSSKNAVMILVDEKHCEWNAFDWPTIQEMYSVIIFFHLLVAMAGSCFMQPNVVDGELKLHDF